MEEQQVNVEQEEVTTEQTQETTQETTRTKEELTEKLDELNKKYLLLYSDFENFRKRTSKEKIELIQNAAENTIKDLLPVVDDYERALANFEKFEDEKFVKAKEGIELIYNKLMSILTQKGLKPMNAKGEKFDENLHEAIAQMPAESEEQKGVILDETTKGYYLHEKVIRYAKVVVAM
ncbi:MAG: nucleotide exchange factor GrpE [Bacteroidales bacterium]|nr:nucleotide exchange factor GrpE [Bacteroidales bacterium]